MPRIAPIGATMPATASLVARRLDEHELQLRLFGTGDGRAAGEGECCPGQLSTMVSVIILLFPKDVVRDGAQFAEAGSVGAGAGIACSV